MNFFLSSLVPILFAIFILGSHGQKGESGGIPFDVSQCFEYGNCAIKSIGSFSTKDVDNVTSIEGHIYEVSNGLLYDAYFYWDVIGESEDLLPSASNQNSMKKALFIPSGEIRYFDSLVYKTHTLRLFIKLIGDVFESVDRAVGLEEKKSSEKKRVICDYLFRICYFDDKYNNNDKNNNTKCKYDSPCKSFYKKSEEDSYIDTWITTYYGHLLNDKEKISPNFNRLNLVQCLIENQRKINGIETNNIWSGSGNNAIITASSSSYIKRLETTITVLSILLVVLVLFCLVCLFFWIRHKYVMTRHRIEGNEVVRMNEKISIGGKLQDEEEEEEDMKTGYF